MQPGSRGRIVRKTTTELVVDAMRARILSGEFPPGTPLRQELLAEDLGVSRIPVREALRLLSAEGLVDTIAHKGAFVSMLSKSEVQEFFDIRKRLEPWILREAIPNISDQDLQRAEQLVHEMDTTEPGMWGSLNWELHESLYRAAGRPAALSVVRALHEKSERYFRFQVVNAPIRQQAHREHMALITLCRGRQIDEAEAMLERHIDDAAQQILSIVERLLDQAPMHQ
ncbi:GntR family transcriptional regulator [Bordetella genomosp. 13]|uniref:GntR family transcriptional regulator n=1 Tax=Bordetella genomosp. 13 TaxID=463040 RepID=A0A1W6ZA07_9BORD|nr:GntR family transcriptional regulator [Bordetella genomosp. 13]ARP94201.1 GntR family transcriptional regulator [Bordetella genomosp. 13]